MRRTQVLFYWMGRAFIASVLVGVLAMWWATSGDPEDHPILALLQYIPYLAYLLPAILALLLSCWMSWVWRALSLGGVLVALVALMGLSLGQAEQGHGHLRVMTYNVKSYYAVSNAALTSELALEILAHDPDVVAMQDAGLLMSLRQTQPDLFKTMIGPRDVQAFGQYIVASRFPIKHCAPGLIPFRDQPHTYFYCVLKVHDQDVNLVTVHFTTPRDGLNATRFDGIKGLGAWRVNVDDRVAQSTQLAVFLNTLKGPRIVAGDLNAPDSSTVVKTLLRTGMRDAFSVAGKGYGFTHGHSLWPGISFLRIDHVLASEDMAVVAAHAGGKAGSQHRPVIADLKLVRE